jgi:cellulose synthase/poly-beta-1,6-N-acetylglucosamine synthase-like glycosyltransferase
MYYFLAYNPEHEESPKELENQFILTLDGDVKFKPKAVQRLVELMDNDERVGAACGRIIPEGSGTSF